MSFDSLANYTIPFVSRDEFQQMQQAGVFSFGNIKAEGSFGRQLSFGNARMLYLIQVSIYIEWNVGRQHRNPAAITDNNIPIQPDGTHNS